MKKIPTPAPRLSGFAAAFAAAFPRPGMYVFNALLYGRRIRFPMN
jgi:hypothetical protein